MTWDICIRYPDGKERTLRTYQDREVALRQVDAIYDAQGYPMHIAYIVRPGSTAGSTFAVNSGVNQLQLT